jgi:hypothetical protein
MPVASQPPPQARAITKIETKTVVVRQKRKKNAIFIVGGVGPVGASGDVQAQSMSIAMSQGAVGGVQYQRSVGDDILLGATVLTNSTATLNLGLEF